MHGLHILLETWDHPNFNFFVFCSVVREKSSPSEVRDITHLYIIFKANFLVA